MCSRAEFGVENCSRFSWLCSGPGRHQLFKLRLSPVEPSAPGPIAVRAKKGKQAASPVWETPRLSLLKLPPDTEPLDNDLVARFITHFDIVKQFAALADQLEQPAA